MAKIIEITNPLTGQPQPAIQSDYTAQQIDDAVAAVQPLLPGGPGLPVNQGGTGANNPQAALVNLGARPNRNLFINAIAIGGGGTGAFPINQRGKTSYTDGTAIDGWKITGNGGQEAAIQEDGILLTSTAQYGAYWIQTVDPNEVASLIGKTLTCSCYMGENGGYRPAASIYRNGEYWKFFEPKENDIASLTFEVPEGTTSLFFQIGADGSGTTVFKAAKLEESPVQTLGYKDADGNVHILDTPDYGQELARCQRRLLKLGPNGATGYAENPTTAYLFVPLPVTMRAKPVWSGTLPRLYPNDGNSVSSVSVISIADNMACLMASGTGFTSGKLYSANELDGFLSAEL